MPLKKRCLCSICKRRKPRSSFHPDKGRRTGASSRCKTCQADMDKKRKGRRSYKHIEARRTYVTDIRKANRCKICGNPKWYLLDFHHRDPKTKVFSIGSDCIRYDIPLIALEIEKCDVLCANCHRELHHNMRQLVGFR